MLGVEPTADEAEIRLAYARLARILHPDAVLDPSLAGLRGLREAAFVQLGQAVETLRSPGFRQYAAEKALAPGRVRRRAAGAATPPPPTVAAPEAASQSTRPAPVPVVSEPATPPVDPEVLLRAARQHFEAERYWDAIQVLEPLLPHAEGATRTQARLLLAQAYIKNPRWRKRAERDRPRARARVPAARRGPPPAGGGLPRKPPRRPLASGLREGTGASAGERSGHERSRGARPPAAPVPAGEPSARDLPVALRYRPAPRVHLSGFPGPAAGAPRRDAAPPRVREPARGPCGTPSGHGREDPARGR